jgi:formate dehydrogenase subunit delta
MENRDMIRMANQIAAYFEAYPRTEALDGIAHHIRNFWTVGMRKQLTDYIGDGAEGLSRLQVCDCPQGLVSQRPDGAARPLATAIRWEYAHPTDRRHVPRSDAQPAYMAGGSPWASH